MKKRPMFSIPAILAVFSLVPAVGFAQPQARLYDELRGQGARPKLAVTDFRGTRKAAAFMSSFTRTLYSDLQGSGLFDMVSKSLVPTQQPQRPEDFRPESGTRLAM